MRSILISNWQEDARISCVAIPDLEDTIRRLQAYEAARAKVLMAPGLPDLEAERAVCDTVSAPFNFMVGILGKSFTFAGLQEAGIAGSASRHRSTGLPSAR